MVEAKDWELELNVRKLMVQLPHTLPKSPFVCRRSELETWNITTTTTTTTTSTSTTNTTPTPTPLPFRYIS